MAGCGSCKLIWLAVAAASAGVIAYSVVDDKPAAAPAQTPPAQTTPAAPDAKPATPAPAPVDRYVLGLSLPDIDGVEQDLAQYKGKVILMVNVASECGFTGQYKGLQELYDAKKDKGFVILGFPANNFRGQEPGSNAEIKKFCTEKYSVTFPMFSKISVKGDDAHPLFKKLTAAAGEPEWNFNKYLVDKDGNVVHRYQSRTKPGDAELGNKIDELLAATAK